MTTVRQIQRTRRHALPHTATKLAASHLDTGTNTNTLDRTWEGNRYNGRVKRYADITSSLLYTILFTYICAPADLFLPNEGWRSTKESKQTHYLIISYGICSNFVHLYL